MPQIGRLSRELFWVLLGQGVGAVGALVGVRLMTHALDPLEYGTLALGMTAVTLANQAVLGPLSEGSVRFYSVAAQSGELRGYLRAVRRMTAAAIGILVFTGVLAASGLAVFGTSHGPGILVGAAALAVLAGLSSVLVGVQNAARHRVTVAWHDALSPWLRYLPAAALIAWSSATAGVALAGYATGAGLALAVQAVFFSRTILRRGSAASASTGDATARYRHDIGSYAWPIAIWGVFTWAQLASDRWALELYRGTGEVGRYAVLYQLGYYPVALMGFAATELAAPILFARAGDASSAARVAAATALSRGVMVVLGVLTAVGASAAWMLHAPVFQLLVGPEYRAVSHWLPVVVLSAGLVAMGQAATTGALAGQRTHRLLAPKIGTALLACGLNFAGAALFGMPGVIVAGLVFGATYLAWMSWVLAR